MYYLYSGLSKDKYLAAMKQKFDNPLYIFDERMTGVTLGPFFAVAHYQAYEWNRKITSECNRAWGIVKEVDGELEITFIRGKGMLSLGCFLLWTLICRVICLFIQLQDSCGLEWGNGWWIMSAVCSLIVCIASAVESCLTEAGAAGAYEIEKFLENPEEYYC